MYMQVVNGNLHYSIAHNEHLVTTGMTVGKQPEKMRMV